MIAVRARRRCDRPAQAADYPRLIRVDARSITILRAFTVWSDVDVGCDRERGVAAVSDWVGMGCLGRGFLGESEWYAWCGMVKYVW